MSDSGYANAVCVSYRDGDRWVTDPAAIAAFGDRVEGHLAVGDAIAEVSVVDWLGGQWLAARTSGRRSVLVEVDPTGVGDVPGVDFGRRQTVTAGPESDLEVIGETFSWSVDDESKCRTVPELANRTDVARVASDRAIQRIVSRNGGATAVSTATDVGTSIPTGAVSLGQQETWSWSDSSELSLFTAGWQPAPAEKPYRLYRWEITADASTATGTSQFRFWVHRHVGGTLIWSGLLDITLPTGAGQVTQAVTLFGHTTVLRGDWLYPACISNGGHKNGSIRFLSADLV